MTRIRAVGLVLLLCIAAVGWFLVRQPPTTPPTSTSTGPARRPPATAPAPAARSGAEPSSPPATETPLAVTPRPTVLADVPQDRGASPGATPGPDQRRVEAEEPSVDQLTDAQLQAALDRQTAGQGRLEPALQHAAAAAAWKQIQPTLTASRTWSHIEQRAAVALLIGQDDPAQPIPVKVVTTWTGTDPDGLIGVHRAETKLLYVDNTWQPLN